MTAVPLAPRVEAREPRSSATSALIRWAVFLGGMALILLRIPQTEAMLVQQIPQTAPADMEPELVRLSVSVALLLGTIAFGIVLAMYLGFAAILERKLFPGELRFGKNLRLGLFTAVIVAAVVPVQVWSMLSGGMPSPALKAGPVIVCCLGVLFLYRRSLRDAGRARAAFAGLGAVALGAAVAIV